MARCTESRQALTPGKGIGRAALIVRLVLAGVFLYAGATKAFEAAAFAQAIERYRVLPHILAVATALYLPWLEIVCGLALFLPRWRAGAIAILGVLSVVFVVMIVSALARGLDIDCGCFGSGAGGGVGLWLSLVRAVALAVACGWLLIGEARRQRAFLKAKPSERDNSI